MDQVHQRTYAASTYLSQMRGAGPDQFSQVTAEAVERSLDEIEKWVKRSRAHFDHAKRVAPDTDLELTPAGVAAIEHAAEGAPPKQVPVDGIPPVERSNVKPFSPRVVASTVQPIRDYPGGDGPSAA
jgi:hypothetical protein